MPASPFGQYIKEKRVDAKLSLRQVANDIGVSHVYLGEVERGVRAPLTRERWPALMKAIPGLHIGELERLSKISRPLELSVRNAPPQYQNLALALARRIERQNLGESQIERLMKELTDDGGDDDASE